MTGSKTQRAKLSKTQLQRLKHLKHNNIQKDPRKVSFKKQHVKKIQQAPGPGACWIRQNLKIPGILG